jgi:hypothetical protein
VKHNPHVEMRWMCLYRLNSGTEYLGGMVTRTCDELPVPCVPFGKRVQVRIEVIGDVRLPKHWGEVRPAKKARKP